MGRILESPGVSKSQEGASVIGAGSSGRGVPAEPSTTLGLRTCEPGGGSSRTNLLACGGVGVEGGPDNGHFRVLCKKGGGGSRSRAEERKGPVAGRAGQGLCF